MTEWETPSHPDTALSGFITYLKRKKMSDRTITAYASDVSAFLHRNVKEAAPDVASIVAFQTKDLEGYLEGLARSGLTFCQTRILRTQELLPVPSRSRDDPKQSRCIVGCSPNQVSASYLRSDHLHLQISGPPSTDRGGSGHHSLPKGRAYSVSDAILRRPAMQALHA